MSSQSAAIAAQYAIEWHEEEEVGITGSGMWGNKVTLQGKVVNMVVAVLEVVSGHGVGGTQEWSKQSGHDHTCHSHHARWGNSI